MKIASWNINSIRARLDLLLDWLETNDPDIVCLQETKVTDQEFPEDEIGDLDYDVTYFGQRSYNGVAIISKSAPAEVERGLPTDDADADRRYLAATLDGIRVVNIYAPNGQSMEAEQFGFKLDWYARVKQHLSGVEATPLLVTGDFNIAPGPLDAHDADKRAGGLFMSAPEHAAFRGLLDLGLTETFRHQHPEKAEYTWWDYRAAGFQRNAGLRIDHFLLSEPLVKRVDKIWVDRDMRGVDNASDHAPVFVTLNA